MFMFCKLVIKCDKRLTQLTKQFVWCSFLLYCWTVSIMIEYYHCTIIQLPSLFGFWGVGWTKTSNAKMSHCTVSDSLNVFQTIHQLIKNNKQINWYWSHTPTLNPFIYSSLLCFDDAGLLSTFLPGQRKPMCVFSVHENGSNLLWTTETTEVCLQWPRLAVHSWESLMLTFPMLQ